MNPMLLVLLYLLAGVVGFKFKRIAYVMVATVAALSILFLYAGMGVNPTQWYFIFLSSLAWLFISLFSLSYEIDDGILASTFAFTTGMMLLILLSKDAITFLLGWEGMTVASFFSLYSHKNSRRAAYLFIAFGETSFIFILSGFLLASAHAGTTVFSAWGTQDWSTIYMLMAIGFMIKMAAVPAHIWLPEAHSRAPANMSAQLSAVMTLMGLYGLVSFLNVCVPGSWVGAVLLIIGGVSALIGVFYAAICDHVKKLPAYSTVENDGVLIALVGAFIITYQNSQHVVAAFMLLSVMFFAFAHTIAKSLLFIIAGKLEKSGGEYLGGKYRLTPIGAFAGYVAAISLAGVPPLPGFIAEWTALESMFQSFYFSDLWLRVLTVSVGALIALTAGISTIAMSKFIVHGVERRERGPLELSDLGLAIGTALLVFGGFLPQFIFRLSSPVISGITGVPADRFMGGLFGIPDGYLIISGKGFGVLSPTLLFIFIVGVFLTVYLIMRRPMRRRRVVRAWSGGLKNEEYPTRAHSSILLLTQKWLFRTDEKMQYSDMIHNAYIRIGTATQSASEKFRGMLMPGNDRRYVLYILIALLVYLAIAML
ncbi:MAG: NADH-quinone oxidoreductase subunit E [Euryarchaeota archaeon]|nr:NADH-quinone oxidoreductase subunit E [Euryarchaeota archaeon]